MHQVLPLSAPLDLRRDHLDLYRHMALAREIDGLEERLVSRGEAFFHVSGAGHEAVAAIAPHLRACDWLHCHYRDKALMIARGMPARMFFDNLFCGQASPSRGRQMSAHFSWREGHVLSLCGPVGNNALQAAGIAAEVKDTEGQPVVVCCLGDGTTQQGEVLEAIAEAVRATLPVVFLIENNALAISTPTRGKTFFSLPGFDAPEFMGLGITYVDGTDAVECEAIFGDVVRAMRASGGPAIVVMDVERLSNHTHADDQRQYRTAAELSDLPRRDPLARFRDHLAASGASADLLGEIARTAVEDARDAMMQAQRDLDQPRSVFGAKRDLPADLRPGSRTATTVRAQPGENTDRTLPMGAAIAEVLRERMRDDPRVTLFGQDIEDPKGDVFGVTRGLSTEFGGRVRNAPLSEATIVGTAVGRALAGGRPVAFLQFADFLPLAFNQIASELATIFWRTDGEWECPVILMLPSGGYRQGLGPFHAQSFEAIACHIPGLDVLYPATAADACGLLNAAFESRRPTLFFYPKALLHDARVATTGAAVRGVVALGAAAIVRAGSDITLVAYGNGVGLCQAAADWLAEVGLAAEIIDLRSLSPLDEGAILTSVRKTGRLITAHEDVGTCGIAAEIMARVAEKTDGVKMARAVRADTFVPCNFANQLDVLPSARTILEAAAALLDLDLAWSAAAENDDNGVRLVRAAGSPSDETVTVLECAVAPGQRVREGDRLATFETVKAAVEFESPVDGTVADVFVTPGEVVKVGAPFLSIATRNQASRAEAFRAPELRPTLSFRRTVGARAGPGDSRRPVGRPATRVGVLSIATKLGSQVVRNADVAARHAGRTAEHVDRLTGIVARRQIAEGETALSLGAEAARRALAEASLTIADIDVVICATGTPGLSTPSLACRILHDLGGPRLERQAFDISAACSGYLYGLQAAYDILQAGSGKVLLVTSEVLTPLVDGGDFETSMLFSDGASATVLGSCQGASPLVLSRPVLSGSGEPGKYLTVPTSAAEGVITMDGAKVFSAAVRSMADMLLRACAAASCSVQDLDVLVPHQANRRILDAVAARLGLPADKLVANIRERGNTSSSTIPICLSEHWASFKPGQTIGLTAFGGGFTYGAALLHVP